MRGIAVSLRKHLPGFELDTEWNVEPGFTVLFGYSGAGKSLTLAMISGTMRPDHGRVVVDDVTYLDTGRGLFVTPQKRRVGLVSQVADLFPHMSVRANIEYGLLSMPRPERAERASQMMESLRISDLAKKRPGELSGGQRQRAALARALSPRPRLLLLDEPLSALDLPIRMEMRELLRQLQREYEVPVVMVTHDLREACELADTLVVYSGTGFVQVGTPDDVLSAPSTPEIQLLIECASESRKPLRNGGSLS